MPQLRLEGAAGSQQLTSDALDPRFMRFLGRPQVSFVDDLNALLACSQGESDDTQRMLKLGKGDRHQALARAGERFSICKDQGGVHQHFGIVAHQCRCLDQFIFLPTHHNDALKPGGRSVLARALPILVGVPILHISHYSSHH